MPLADGSPPGILRASGFVTAKGFLVLSPLGVRANESFFSALAKPLILLSGLPELFAVPRFLVFGMMVQIIYSTVGEFKF